MHSDETDSGLFLDADLSILGAPAELYAAYARAIRAEYAHVPQEAYVSGRSAVLGRMLARPCLYYSSYGRQRLLGQAAANLQAELACLAEGRELEGGA